MVAPIATTRIASPSNGLARVRQLATQVEESNACSLPGCPIKYDSFLTVMWRAVARGYVEHEHAVFVAQGLKQGFTAGVKREELFGQRIFKNYKSAVDAMEQVGRATQGRIDDGKTLCLGDWGQVNESLRDEVKDFYVFPLGAVPKPLEPTEMRPASDHTKTGLNHASDMSFLKHSLTAHKDVAWLLRTGYFMYVSDVEAAFTVLPLAPWLWWFFLFRVQLPGRGKRTQLCMHLTGDFGTRGMPGCFYIFYAKVVLPMARSELVVSLPLVVYVDDNSMIGAVEDEVNHEMEAMQAWCLLVVGLSFKWLKDRKAAQRQLYIGFWWDSRSLTLELEERKLGAYVVSLLEFAERRTASLHELRSLAGKAQRAVMTMPPGAACLVTNFFLLMSGLMLPWHKRRVPRAARCDAEFIARLLELNLGRGCYSYAHFGQAPVVYSDACKGGYAGGGYFSADGPYRFWQYGTSASRQLIDYLEGDTSLVAVEDLSAGWRGCMVPFGIDNMSYQRSEKRGRSRATRLNDLLKALFVRQVQGGFILDSFWLSSEDNELADDLSRNREEAFLMKAQHRGAWLPGAIPRRHPRSGQVRQLTERERPAAMAVLRQLLSSYTTNTNKDGPEGAVRFALTVPHQRTTLTQGLPVELLPWLEQVLDNRLAPSSWRTVNTALAKWRKLCAERGWPVVLRTDDPDRGGRLTAFMHYMVEDTELVWGSIQNYLWGLRTWMKLQHQADPAYGIEHWDMLQQSCEVLTAVPSEPRKELPMPVLRAILLALDPNVFWEAQFGFFLLVLLFTFSRSECPCPKNFTGPESFDEEQHWQVGDFKFEIHETVSCIVVRFKRVKQDPRVQRPQARGEDGKSGDWSYVGDIPDSLFSVVRWFKALLRHWSTGNRPKDEPMFLARDQTRPYTYGAAMSDLARMLERVGVQETYGLHSLRVSGYNWSKRGNGVDITVAHGLWMSSAHTRYERFPMSDVVRIPAKMLGEDHPDTSAVVERAAAKPPRLQRGSRATAASAPAAVRPASSSSSSSEVDETVQQRARRLAAARVVAATNERPPARRVAAAAARGASAQRSARRR